MDCFHFIKLKAYLFKFRTKLNIYKNGYAELPILNNLILKVRIKCDINDYGL